MVRAVGTRVGDDCGSSPSLQSIYGISEDTQELLDAGYLTAADLATTDLDDVATIEGISLDCAETFIDAARSGWVTDPTTKKNSDCLRRCGCGFVLRRLVVCRLVLNFSCVDHDLLGAPIAFEKGRDRLITHADLLSDHVARL